MGKSAHAFGVAEGSKDCLVPEGVLPALHHESEPVVYALSALLLHHEINEAQHQETRRKTSKATR